ncbi:MAG TPA: RtcB family protein [Micromonosporaceae bacterium]|nr:RtcB family protein [Micromonosporaceae bacterium]
MSAVYGARVPIRMWADPATVESAAMAQLRNLANLPWIEGVAVMPNIHAGKGAAVGSVIVMRQAVSPAAVGVDIGCGMTAVRTSLTSRDLPTDLAGLRARIEDAVPVGFTAHDGPIDPLRMPGLGAGWDAFWGRFANLHPAVQRLRDRAARQLGTLGGGSHFIEICVEPEAGARGADPVWIMLHSGSRDVGKELAERHMAVARTLPHNAGLPDRDLAVFLTGTPEMDAYRRDVSWAREYASRNRGIILALVQRALRRALPSAAVGFDEPISCHHNDVVEEAHDGVDVLVSRKGAIRACTGELGIIPGSMGTGSYIVRGLGNPAAYSSAANGAGRVMSRSAAKRTFSVDDLAAQTAGVECRKDARLVDEIPAAYQDIENVIAAQKDLVEVVAHLRQVVCVKG